MTVRLRASVIPGLLALAALGLTACSSSGTVGANGSGGVQPPGTAKSSAAANTSADTATGPAASDPAPTSATGSSAAPTDPATSSASADPSALASSLKTLNQLWTDQGCKIGLAGFSVYAFAQQQGAAQGIAAIPNALPQIHQGAQLTRKPDAADAMNKLAADMLAVYTQAQQGQNPDRGPIKSDFQRMGDACSQQQP